MRRSKLCDLAALAMLFAASGCARDVVIKPAVIAFDSDARVSVDAARRQYDEAVVRLNGQTADFLARNPDCGLTVDIVPRRRNPAARATGPYCLSEREREALPGNVRPVTEKLPLFSRETFAPQFEALDLLLGYVTFLADRADEPDLSAKADITATADGIKALGQGVSGLRTAFGKSGFSEFDDGGPVETFGTAIGDLAEQFEIIARQANDVKALEATIKVAADPVGKAIDGLAASSDAWSCAAFERSQIDANSYALAWNQELPHIELDRRREVAGRWIGLLQSRLPAYCPGAGKPAAIRSPVAEMFIALKSANNDLIDIANHNYTPAQRKAIVLATLSRLGAVLSRISAVISALP